MEEPIKLYNDDCLKLLPTLSPGSVDMIIADLPYGTTQCEWDKKIPLDEFWRGVKHCIKDDGAILVFGTQPFFSEVIQSNRNWFRYELIWEKERPTNIFFIKKQFGRCHEDIAVFYQHQPTYNPQMENRATNETKRNAEVYFNYRNNGSLTHRQPKYRVSADYNPKKRYPRDVLKFNRDLSGKKDRHPTQKPVALLECLIRTYTNPGDVVLDPVMGSGSTGVACKNLNRGFIGIELDKKYYQLAKDRLGV